MDEAEKLAEALYSQNPDKQPWDGDPFGFKESLHRGGHQARLALTQARMLFALGLVDADKLAKASTNMWELRKRRY